MSNTPAKKATPAAQPKDDPTPKPDSADAAGSAPAAAETTEPSTEDGERVVYSDDSGNTVTVESPGLPYGAEGLPKRECVVPGDFHIGSAVPGTKVCSYHTMHYDNDGRRREPGQAQKRAAAAEEVETP